jgi:hypothetical protein
MTRTRNTLSNRFNKALWAWCDANRVSPERVARAAQISARLARKARRRGHKWSVSAVGRLDQAGIPAINLLVAVERDRRARP